MGKASIWVETTAISALIFLLITPFIMRINSNPYVLFPVINISISIGLLISLCRNEVKKRGFSAFKDRAWKIGTSAMALSILVSLSILLIRISYNIQEAMLFSVLMVIATTSMLTSMLAFTLVEPEYLMKKRITDSVIMAVFMFFSVFLSSAYAVKYALGEFPFNISKINGMYYELRLSEAGFGWLYPAVKISFLMVVAGIILASTMQYLKIKNKTIKRYYSVLYFSLVTVVLAEITIVSFLSYILKIETITFFSLLASIMSFVLTYYLIHIREIFLETEKIKAKRTHRKGALAIFPKEEGDRAIKLLEDYLKKGRSALIFSTSEASELMEILKDYGDRITHILITSDGYRIGESLFSDISDIECLKTMKNLQGVVVYSSTLDEGVGFPCEKRGELLRYYRFLLKITREGGVVVSPVERDYLITREGGVVKNPVWAIKPIIALRFEELLNVLYSKIQKKKSPSFLNMIRDMEKIGMPKIYMSKGRLCLDLKEEIDRERFSILIKWIENGLEENKIMKKEEYFSLLRDFFEEYGKEYYLTVMMWKGEINFIDMENSREKAMRLALSFGNNSMPTLIISRINPHILRRKYGFDDRLSLRWLATTESEDTLYPHLEEIKKEIFSYVEGHEESVIVLDGLEYLVKMHGFDAVLNLLWILQDRVSTTKSIVLIPINPGVLERKNLEALRRDFHFLK